MATIMSQHVFAYPLLAESGNPTDYAHDNFILLYEHTWGYFFYYNDVIMGAIASLITSLTIVYSTISDADQRKHRKMFPFEDVIMT